MEFQRDTVRAAAIQLCSTRDRSSNLALCNRLMQRAIVEGAELIALPENFSFLGDDGEKLHFAEDIETGPSIQFLRTFAKDHGVTIVGGTVPLSAPTEGKVTNSCFVVRPDGSLGERYDKIHLFDIDLDESTSFCESAHIRAGDLPVVFSAFGHVMGLSICYDVRFPELYRKLSSLGSEVIFVPAAFTVPTGEAHWEILLRARAIENQCFIVAPAQSGAHTSTRSSYGHTMIVNPWGEILGTKADGDAIVVADLDFRKLRSIRNRLPALKHRKI